MENGWAREPAYLPLQVNFTCASPSYNKFSLSGQGRVEISLRMLCVTWIDPARRGGFTRENVGSPFRVTLPPAPGVQFLVCT